MHLPRLLAFTAILTLSVVPAPAGSAVDASGTCGLAIGVQDPDIQAAFTRFERSQSAAAAKACAFLRNDMAAAATASH